MQVPGSMPCNMHTSIKAKMTRPPIRSAYSLDRASSVVRPPLRGGSTAAARGSTINAFALIVLASESEPWAFGPTGGTAARARSSRR